MSMRPPRNPEKRRLRDLLTIQFRPIHLVIGLLTMLLGFALVAQIKLQSADPLDGVHEDELVALLDQLTRSETQLRTQRSELTEQLSKLQDAQSKEQAAREAAEKEKLQSQILGGTVPVEGPGLVMIVHEGDTPISAQKFVTVLGELRNAGAEAIELNGVRITASSYITRDDQGLAVSNERIASPYMWKIIGDPDTIQPALEIARGATSQLRATGANIEIQREDLIVIDSVATPMTYKFAVPVE